jgi:hypothetical protein
MSRVPQLGTVEDREQHSSLAREDDHTYRQKISDARDLIYVKNYAVNTTQIEDKLKDDSLTPNAVGFRPRNLINNI